MSIESRLVRLERQSGARAELFSFRVIVPPKMTREEWRQKCREMGRTGERVFTIDLDGANVFGGEDE